MAQELDAAKIITDILKPRVPEITSSPPNPGVPRIKAEETVYAGSAFITRTNLDTGESWVEKVY